MIVRYYERLISRTYVIVRFLELDRSASNYEREIYVMKINTEIWRKFIH